jgi:hypothetical protein
MRFRVLAFLTVILFFTGTGIAQADLQVEPDIQVLVTSEQTINDAVDVRVSGLSQDLGALASGKVANLISVDDQESLLQTNASANQKNVAAVVSSTGSIALGWDFQDQSQPVEVAVNGELIAEVPPTGSISSQNVILEGATQVSFSQVSEPNSEQNLNANQSDVTFATISFTVVQPDAPTLQAATAAVTALATQLASSTVLRYQTFIPTEYAPVPPAGCSMSLWYELATGRTPFYLGNNRGFEMPSSNNKTAAQVNVDWLSGSMTLNKTVSPTDGVLVYPVENSRLYVYHDLAGDSQVFITYGTFYSNSVYVHLHHDVANPDCVAQGIYYDIRGQIFRNGGYSLSGEFRNVPNHEFFIKDSSNPSWRPIYRASITSALSFACFTPGNNASSCVTTSQWTDAVSVWYLF